MRCSEAFIQRVGLRVAIMCHIMCHYSLFSRSSSAQIKQNGSNIHPNLSCKVTKAPLQCLGSSCRGFMRWRDAQGNRERHLHSQWKRSDSTRQDGFMKRVCLKIGYAIPWLIDVYRPVPHCSMARSRRAWQHKPTARLGLLLEHFHNGCSLHNFLNFQISQKMLLDSQWI